MNHKQPHLTEDQIIISAVSQQDLDDSTRRHLEDCSTCRRQSLALARDLNVTIPAAFRENPPPRPRTTAIITRAVDDGGRARLFLAPVLASAMVIVCFFSLLYVSDPFPSGRQASPLSSALLNEIEADRELAEALDVFEARALSGFTAQFDTTGFPDNELIKLMVPLPSEQPGDDFSRMEPTRQA